MTRPRLLDLFCGAGGAAMGYYRAGFDVVGVDINKQSHYPFTFVQADAMTYPLGDFDVIHASPPCQAYSRAGHLRTAQGGKVSAADLVQATVDRMPDKPWIVENVPGAPIEGLTLCGSSFGLRVRRHRVFASNVALLGMPCDHKAQGKPVGVYHVMGDHVPQGGTTAVDLADGQDAMGIDWMTWKELKESIPPAYTEWIGRQLI